ncbi:MAG: hypothetical protein LC131_12650, partial [Anaerolineae bacterium]|nr:hypothetical protein [Anaerolineae bacterium]
IIKDGAMKSAQAQVSEQFAKIKTALASYAFSTPNTTHGSNTCAQTIPPATAPFCRLLPAAIAAGTAGLTQADITDPWGSTIRYAPAISSTSGSGLGLSNSTVGNAYTLSSDGPDKAQGTPDDINVTVSAVELRQMIGTSNLP